MKKNSTMEKTIHEVACKSRKQPYTAEEALSESEINAVIQLIQLSSADNSNDEDDDNIYSSSSNNNFSFISFINVNEDSGKSLVHNKVASSSSSSSPSLLSSPSVLMEEEKGELLAEKEDHDDGGDRSYFRERKNKRYRSILELYRVTDSHVRKKNKKQCTY